MHTPADPHRIQLTLEPLVGAIHSLTNSQHRSQLILPPPPTQTAQIDPIGVLLLKPSSGYLPLETIREILLRLLERHGYLIRSVAWWSGQDVRSQGMMSRHYSGFHRIAHGGLSALSSEARTKMSGCYSGPGAFNSAFNTDFDPGLVCTPYDLVGKGISQEWLNELWELDRSNEPAACKRIQRLDDDTLALALRLSEENSVPPALRGKVVILLNGFYAKLEKDFESCGCVAIWIQKPPTSTTSWEMLRSDYAGKTNPFQASAGTIRGDAARGILAVETVSILANVIHLSATEAEGRREVEHVWWEPRRFTSVFEKSESRTTVRQGERSAGPGLSLP